MKPAPLADENIPQAIVAGLRAAGFDVVAMAEHERGATDRPVLSQARRAGRWLLVFDGDFGELVLRAGEAPPPAVLYFRLHPVAPERVLALALRALTAGVDPGFVAVTDEGECHRPFAPEPHRGSG